MYFWGICLTPCVKKKKNLASVYLPWSVKHDKVGCSGHRLVEHIHRVRVLGMLIFFYFKFA